MNRRQSTGQTLATNQCVLANVQDCTEGYTLEATTESKELLTGGEDYERIPDNRRIAFQRSQGGPLCFDVTDLYGQSMSRSLQENVRLPVLECNLTPSQRELIRRQAETVLPHAEYKQYPTRPFASTLEVAEYYQPERQTEALRILGPHWHLLLQDYFHNKDVTDSSFKYEYPENPPAVQQMIRNNPRAVSDPRVSNFISDLLGYTSRFSMPELQQELLRVAEIRKRKQVEQEIAQYLGPNYENILQNIWQTLPDLHLAFPTLNEFEFWLLGQSDPIQLIQTWQSFLPENIEEKYVQAPPAPAFVAPPSPPAPAFVAPLPPSPPTLARRRRRRRNIAGAPSLSEPLSGPPRPAARRPARPLRPPAPPARRPISPETMNSSLNAMELLGYPDRQLNRELLEENQGSVTAAINMLPPPSS